MAFDRINGVRVGSAFILEAQSTCPVPAGAVGLWLDSVSGDIKFRLANGTDSADATFVTLAGTQTLTNKTLTAPIINGATASGSSNFDLTGSSGIFLAPAATLVNTTNQLTLGASAHKTIISSTAPAGASNTLTIPDTAGADTFVFNALAATLMNKTISGASNTLSAIANASLSNSAVTVGTTAGQLTGGGSVALGASLTLGLPAVGPGAGTIGNASSRISSVTLDVQGRVTAATISDPLKVDWATTGNAIALAATAGNDTVGSLLIPTIASTLLGIKFDWVGGKGALTMKCSVWDTAGTQLATKSVAINAGGVYTATFTTPVPMTPGTFYSIGAYETSGTWFIAPVPNSGVGMTIGCNMYQYQCAFSAGDAKPTTVGTAAFTVSPVYTIP